MQHEKQGNLLYYQVTADINLVHQVVNALYQLKIQSVLVEGGAKLLQSFIDEDLWDEIRVIENERMKIEEGLAAPLFENSKVKDVIKMENDKITYYYH